MRLTILFAEECKNIARLYKIVLCKKIKKKIEIKNYIWYKYMHATLKTADLLIFIKSLDVHFFKCSNNAKLIHIKLRDELIKLKVHLQ